MKRVAAGADLPTPRLFAPHNLWYCIPWCTLYFGMPHTLWYCYASQLVLHNLTHTWLCFIPSYALYLDGPYTLLCFKPCGTSYLDVPHILYFVMRYTLWYVLLSLHCTHYTLRYFIPCRSSYFAADYLVVLHAFMYIIPHDIPYSDVPVHYHPMRHTLWYFMYIIHFVPYGISYLAVPYTLLQTVPNLFTPSDQFVA